MIDNEILAKSGINCFENFVISCGQRFSSHVWEKTCACILEIFRSTLPERYNSKRRKFQNFKIFIFSLMTWRPDTESTGMTTINETTVNISYSIQ